MITTEQQTIDLRLVDRNVQKNPIIYIDGYQLFDIYHYPHFITILDKNAEGYRIFDTWHGKEQSIDSKTLAKSISSLRNHIRLCPQMIVIN